MRAFGEVRDKLADIGARALRFELRLAPTETQRVFALTVALGILCGFAAVAFHFAISLSERALIERALSASGRTWMFWTVLCPTAGGLAGGILLQFVVPNARGSGVPQVKVAFASREGVVRLRDAAGKFVVSAFQIGSGASLGREGPTVQICSGIASALGRIGRLSARNRHRLIPVGAAAGIAAAFNAPIAAVTFTIEEVVGDLDQTVLSGVIVAAALAAVIERSVLGTQPIFHLAGNFGLSDPRSLLLYALLGVAAAGVSIAFTDGLLAVRKRFREQRRIPLWAQPAVGGFVTGALAVGVMGWKHIGGVNGGGYAVLEEALSGSLPAEVMILLCAAKLVATVFSYSSGGAGGIFAPALFMGATLGGTVGALDQWLFQTGSDTVGAFALVGMGAVFSGTIRAPMTSVLIIVELTSGYGLILPLMIANMSAYALASRWRAQPIYEALLAQDGIKLPHHAARVEPRELQRLAALVPKERPYATLGASVLGRELLCQERDGQQVFPVIDQDRRLVGLITTADLAALAAEPELELLVSAADLMRPPIALHTDDGLLTALELMDAHGLRELPVLDSEGRVVGIIDDATIVQAHLRAASQTEAARRLVSVRRGGTDARIDRSQIGTDVPNGGARTGNES
jgi:CIC family chloride channel protein